MMPPTNAFWSLTAYTPEHFFVENPSHRYAIGDRDALRITRTAQRTFTCSTSRPPAREANWLPTPKGPKGGFNLILRIYWPKPEALSGSWKPPPAQRVP